MRAACGRRPASTTSHPPLNHAHTLTRSPASPPLPFSCSPPIDLRFDRPFSFDIVHDQSGLELFNGEIYKPDEWKEE